MVCSAIYVKRNSRGANLNLTTNRRSSQITDGPERAAHRALLYSTGIQKKDLEKPKIGIVNSYNQIVPGHVHLQELGDTVAKGVESSGGISFESNTVAVCDGLCQGHSGMRYPLPSRDLIADSVEIMIEAHQLDGVVLISSCDKIIPGMLMGAIRVDVPTIMLTGGPMEAGSLGEQYPVITLSDMREYIGHYRTGEISLDQLTALEHHACPGPGSCSMMGTANTMACVAEALGMTLPNVATAPAVSAEKRRLARETGSRVVDLVTQDITPSEVITKESIINSVRVAMALGGSTNTFLHLPALAFEAGIDVKLADLGEVSSSTPYLCDIKPGGTHSVKEFHEEGGVQTLMKELSPHLNLTCTSVSRKSLESLLMNADLPNGGVIRDLDNPKFPEGSIAVLRGNLAPKGAVVKQVAVDKDMKHHSGPATVFSSMEDAVEAFVNEDIEPGSVIVLKYEGPKGGPGMREMHMVTSLLMGMGMGDNTALITDGRFSGSTRGPCVGHISPEAAERGPIAIVEDGDMVEIDISNRRLHIELPSEEIEKRLSKLDDNSFPQHEVGFRSYLNRYGKMASSPEYGGVMDTRNLGRNE